MALLMTSLPVHGQESDADAGRTEDEPVASGQVETVEVEGQRGGDREAPTGMTSTVVTAASIPVPGDGVADLAASAAGVARNGQGGLFQSIAIRGTARQRILQLVDGMRITSERRAGPALSFVDPLLLEEVDVLRGPASSAYGPGALGGVVQVFPAHLTAPRFSAGYSSDGHTRVLAGGGGTESFSLAVARRQADNSETATGETMNSAFRQWSAVVSGRWGQGPRQYRLMWVPSVGRDIGKPNTDYPRRVTIYPREDHHLLRFAADGGAGWQASAWLHPQSLETRVSEEDGSLSRVDHEALDMGGRWRREHGEGRRVRWNWGVDTFHRRGVRAEETQWPPPGQGPAVTSRTLDDAAQDEVSPFAGITGKWGRTAWEAGGRVSWLEQRQPGAEAVRDLTGSGFFGARIPLRRGWSLRAHAGTGWRFPTLSERFFSGTTGRGLIQGNPDLKAERSMGVEAGAQWLGRSWLIQAMLFHTRIDDFIDRIEVAPDVRTFVNLTEGRIRGVELEGAWHGPAGWELAWGGHLMHGRDADGRPLADVSPDEVFVGAAQDSGRWGFNSRFTWRGAKSDAGSGEQAIGSAALLDLALVLKPAPAWRLELRGSNLLDTAYQPTADDKAQQAPGRAVGLFVSWSGS